MTKFQFQPVVTRDLSNALTETVSIYLDPFFQQWIYRPGHPILEYTWRWDEPSHEVALVVKQVQDTSDGTPMFQFDTTAGIFSDHDIQTQPLAIRHATDEFRLKAASRPVAVLFDPEHNVIREVHPPAWSTEGLMAVLKFAPNASDREMALGRLLQGQPSDEIVRTVTEALKADRSEYPVFRSMAKLGELGLERLRSFFREEMRHPNFGRRTQAVTALGRLGPTPMDIADLRGLISDQQPYSVIRAALLVLQEWAAAANRDVFERAKGLASPHHAIKALAYDALQQLQPSERADADSVTTASLRKFLEDVAARVKDSPRMAPGLSDETVPRRTATVAGWVKDMKSFSLLAAEGPDGFFGRRVLYYKLTTGGKAIYTTFVVLPDGRVADFDFTRD